MTNRKVLTIFIGHVDAGKSTTCGQIIIKSGQIDPRMISKYSDLAQKHNRESWWIAYIMDTSEEERSKGKTVELGRAEFSLKSKQTQKSKDFIILDAPGHRNYVPNMVTGAALADFAVLIVSARSGEFEAGFERGGQTREHALLAKSSGIRKLIVAVNKMDESSVCWERSRFESIQEKIGSFLKGYGYGQKNDKKKKGGDVYFIPISGQTGGNIFEKCTDERFSWYNGKTLMECFEEVWDEIEEENNSLLENWKKKFKSFDEKKDFENFKDLKIEEEPKIALVSYIENERDAQKLENLHLKVLEGIITLKDELFLPNYKTKFLIENIISENENENIKEKNLFIKGNVFKSNFKLLKNENSSLDSEKSKISEFDIICNEFANLFLYKIIEVKILVVELNDEKTLITKGFSCVLHHLTGTANCEVLRIVGEMENKTKKMVKKKVFFAKNKMTVLCHLRVSEKGLVFREFEKNRWLGRVVLRAGNSTIGIGTVNRLLKRFD